MTSAVGEEHRRIDQAMADPHRAGAVLDEIIRAAGGAQPEQ
ncbi:hypothetical protein [Nocardia sp. NPDC052112]